MLTFRFYKMCPSGNTTILIDDPIVSDPKKRAEIANLVMDANHLGAEQVGYVSFLADGTPRLDMMGGEFCGNATRSLLAYLVDKQHESLTLIGKDSWKVHLSVSGAADLLYAEASKNGDCIDTKVEMPLGANVEEVLFDSQLINIVRMSGITHVLLDSSQFEFSENLYPSFVKRVRESLSLTSQDAVGVIWMTSHSENDLSIQPVVWVKNTDSLYYETACGSGTAALAIALAKKKKTSFHALVRQPSGKEISADVECNNGVITRVSIGGVVNIIAKGELNIYNS